MNIDKYHNVYFIGIGGIGMSALARWFKRKGCRVGGYDRVETALTAELEEKGLDIHYTDSTENIPDYVKLGVNSSLVIYTPAVSSSHSELQYLTNEGFTILKRSEALGLITKDLFTIAVAGTHGKTTTSTILAHILKHSGKSMVAFLGGIASNYNSNLITEGIQDGNTIAIVEADEYDRSFLRLYPNTAIVTSMDADHLDIYGDVSALEEGFNAFVSKLPDNGSLIVHRSVSEKLQSNSQICYGYDSGDISLSVEELPKKVVQVGDNSIALDLSLAGKHNIENAIAAVIAAVQVGVPQQSIEDSVASFSGIKRRFERHIETNEFAYIDDYAHHPQELAAAIIAARELYPDRKLTVVFQPHLFSRTRDFVNEFRTTLAQADEIILLEIYPAREEPIDGVTSSWLAKGLTNTLVIKKEELLDEIQARNLEVLMTLGAGDVDQLVGPLKDYFSLKYLRNEVES